MHGDHHYEGVSDTCELCGKHAPLKHVTFRQNVGLLVMRLGSSVTGFLCRSCIEDEFWRRTLVTLFLGPWGVISFFVTPVFLVMNVAEYISARSLTATRSQVGRKKDGWILPSLVVGGLVLLCPVTCCISLALWPEPQTRELGAACDWRAVPSAAAIGPSPGVVVLEDDGIEWLEPMFFSLPSSMREVSTTREAAVVLCMNAPSVTVVETCPMAHNGNTATRSVLERHGRVVIARTGETIGEATMVGEDPGPCPRTPYPNEPVDGNDPLHDATRLEAAFGPLVEQASRR